MRQRSINIAVAEDEPDLLRAFVRLLELLGHRVVCAAANGAELVAGCAGRRVDVALVDLDMPVVDGLTAAEEIAQQHIPVVLVSGHPDVEHIVLEHEPIAARLVKPVTPEKLVRAIELALAQSSVE